ncbi:hypothetical protein E2542_SST15833 [Spatholobus suberectus]|nr:hypothetical protein E2542_SST15833 [Spatholobus suberectus]
MLEGELPRELGRLKNLALLDISQRKGKSTVFAGGLYDGAGRALRATRREGATTSAATLRATCREGATLRALGRPGATTARLQQCLKAATLVSAI